VGLQVRRGASRAKSAADGSPSTEASTAAMALCFLLKHCVGTTTPHSPVLQVHLGLRSYVNNTFDSVGFPFHPSADNQASAAL
jgi:hypothetical protein